MSFTNEVLKHYAINANVSDDDIKKLWKIEIPSEVDSAFRNALAKEFKFNDKEAIKELIKNHRLKRHFTAQVLNQIDEILNEYAELFRDIGKISELEYINIIEEKNSYEKLNTLLNCFRERTL
jgi:hypothetical protein